MSVENVGFVIPIINGKIYLARRVKNPNKKLWGAIGGKPMTYSQSSIFGKEFIEYIDGKTKLHPLETNSERKNLETSKNAAIREMCEEIFADKKYPDDFKKSDFVVLQELGSRIDYFEGKKIRMDFYLVQINRTDFCINKKELYKKLMPLEKIKSSKIWPLTREILLDLKFVLKVTSFFHQTDGNYIYELSKTTIADQIPNKINLVIPVDDEITSNLYWGVKYLRNSNFQLKMRDFWKILWYHKYYDLLCKDFRNERILREKLFNFLIDEGIFKKEFFDDKEII